MGSGWASSSESGVGKHEKAGDVEVLTKPFGGEVLLPAIRQALMQSRVALDGDARLRSLQSRHSTLGPREREAMTLVASDLLNKQVGGELSISEITVKAHRGRVMCKMQATSLADPVAMAARLGVGVQEGRRDGRTGGR